LEGREQNDGLQMVKFWQMVFRLLRKLSNAGERIGKIEVMKKLTLKQTNEIW
jgi:hypothetical protein